MVQHAIGLRGHPMDAVARVEVPLEGKLLGCFFHLTTSRKRSLGCAHHLRPMYPDFLHGAPPTPACAAFIKESRMKLISARKLDRKSGVRWGEGHPSREVGFVHY
jgi:hypothetical protein